MTNNLNVCAEKIGLRISGTETKIQKIGCLTDDCEIRGEAGRQWISFSVLTVQFQNLGTERKIVYHWNILFRILSRPMCLFINRFPSPSHVHFIHPMFFPHYRMNVKLWKVPSELHRNVIYISSELPKENESVLSNSLITAEFSLLTTFFNYMKTVKPE